MPSATDSSQRFSCMDSAMPVKEHMVLAYTCILLIKKGLLLCSKSKVVPVKVTTIPHPELLAAHLLASLTRNVLEYHGVDSSLVFLWSDSKVVLEWLKRSPATLKTFVANRVADIQEAIEHCSWRHVCSADNPADLISRGSLPRELTSNDLWWSGPKWHSQESFHWPSDAIHHVSLDLPELKRVFHLTTSPNFVTTIVSKFSYLKSESRHLL